MQQASVLPVTYRCGAAFRINMLINCLKNPQPLEKTKPPSDPKGGSHSSVLQNCSVSVSHFWLHSSKLTVVSVGNGKPVTKTSIRMKVRMKIHIWWSSNPFMLEDKSQFNDFSRAMLTVQWSKYRNELSYLDLRNQISCAIRWISWNPIKNGEIFYQRVRKN